MKLLRIYSLYRDDSTVRLQSHNTYHPNILFKKLNDLYDRIGFQCIRVVGFEMTRENYSPMEILIGMFCTLKKKKRRDNFLKEKFRRKNSSSEKKNYLIKYRRRNILNSRHALCSQRRFDFLNAMS